MLPVFCVAILPSIAVAFSDHFLVRQTSAGWIRGRRIITERNVTGIVFLGIPYAEPPTGDRRYRAPVPHAPWPHIIDTQQYGASCLWNSSATTNDPNLTEMSEDCLFMNVLTNQKCLASGGCAIMYYIHGGGFLYDTPSLFSVDFLTENFLTEDRSVIVVMPGFRVGSFGYFNLSPRQNSSISKNAGFLDTIEGLKWVQKEVAIFGGDPQRVTIMGHSTGGTTSNLLTMSPLSKGLFKDAIVMSGGGTNSRSEDENYEASLQLAIAAGCASDGVSLTDEAEIEKILSCLRRIDGKKLLLLQRKIDDSGFSFSAGPCIDGHGGAFPKSVSELRHQRHAEKLLIGTTSQEMSNTRDVLTAGGIDRRRLREYCATAVQVEGLRKKALPILDCVLEYSNSRRAPHILDDISFFVSAARSGNDMLSVEKPTYLYEFQYRFAGKAFNFSHEVPPSGHPQHTEDLVYVMGIHKGIFTEKDEIIRAKYSQIFIDFANGVDMQREKHKWTPLRPKVLNYFAVDFDENNEMPGMKLNYHRRAVKFWNETVIRHGGGTLDSASQLNAQGGLHAGLPADYVTDISERSDAVKLGVTGNGGDSFDDEYETTGVEGVHNGVKSRADTAGDAEKWNSYFWVATAALIITLAVLMVTCYLFCYNYHRRREYERIL